MKKNIFHTTHRKIALATTLLLIVSCIGGGVHLTSCTSTPENAYYIDPVEGNDANSGRSPQEAWKTLEKASTVSLIPGEQLLLKRGATLNGQLAIELPSIAEKKAYIAKQLTEETWESELRLECPHKHYVNMTPAVAECRSKMYAELHGGKV